MKRGSSYALETILPNRASTDRRTDRRTDGQGDSSIPPPNFVAGGIISFLWGHKHCVYAAASFSANVIS